MGVTMTRDEAWKKYGDAKTKLVACIAATYGQDLNLFLPQIMTFLTSGKKLVQPSEALRHLIFSTKQNGVPVFLGEPYALHVSDRLLSHLIKVENWLPDSIPPLESSDPGAAGDVADCVARVREAEVFATSPEASGERQPQDLPMTNSRDTAR